MDSNINKFYGFHIYNNWYCKFPLEQLSIEVDPPRILMSEYRVDKLVERIELKNLRILELGCLEGVHSFILQMLGAREIIAIEGRAENFLRCLIVKNAFKLDKCKFLYGDLNEILSILSGPFDICLALGILYHLRDPISVIYRIAQLARNLFGWTHYSTKDYPKGSLEEIRYHGHIYRGKYVKENIEDYLSGLDKESFWIFEDDIFKVIEDAGFKKIDLINKEKHKDGPAMTFLAQK